MKISKLTLNRVRPRRSPYAVGHGFSNKRAGFTFMELLIAFTIFSIIAASIYYTMAAGIRVYRRGNTIIRDNQRLRLFFDTITRDMRNALPYGLETDKKKLKGMQSAQKKEILIEPEWLGDKATFATLINTYTEEGFVGELARVSYYLDEKKRGGKKIIRTIAGLPEGFDEEYADKEDLLEGLEDFSVEDFTLEYSYKMAAFDDEFDWREEFEEEGVPRGIRITLSLENEERNITETFTDAVFIPRGMFGSDTE